MLSGLSSLLGQPLEAERLDLPGDPQYPPSSANGNKIDVHIHIMPSRLQAVPPAWIYRLTTVLALIAIVFLILRCRLSPLRATASKLIKRRLASGREKEEQKKLDDSPSVVLCEELSEELDDEGEGSVNGRPQTPKGGSAKGAVKDADQKKEERKRQRELESTDGPARKTTRPSAPHEALPQDDLSEEMLDFFLSEALRSNLAKLFATRRLDPNQALPTRSDLPGEPVGVIEQRKQETPNKKVESTLPPLLQHPEGGLQPTPGEHGLPSNASYPPEAQRTGHVHPKALVESGTAAAQPASFTGNDVASQQAYPTARAFEAPRQSQEEMEQEEPASTISRPSDDPSTHPSSYYANHPFYRLPHVPQSLRLTASSMRARIESRPNIYMMRHLTSAREMLAKPSVTASDLQLLLNCGEALAHYAAAYLSKPVKKKSVHVFLRQLSLRFILADTLWCLCEVVGPAMSKEQWWGGFMENLLSGPEGWSSESEPESTRAAASHRMRLANMIIKAGGIYKTGQRPDPEMVVEIKQEILGGKHMFTEFKHPQWEPWRHADKEFRMLMTRRNEEKESADMLD